MPTSLDRAVGWAFIRLHPADFHRALETGKLVPEAAPGARRAEAERVFRERSQRSFTIDAALPRSPWWLMPSVGDAVVDFPWGRKRVLTLAISSGEPEDVNLFDRERRLQICTYPSGGRSARYSEDDRRPVDVLDNDITAVFEPDRLEVRAMHRMRVRLLAPASTLRLRLHDDFVVSSVTSDDGGSLLFFRVRDQGEHRRLARPPLAEGGAVHPDDPLPGPARPRPGGPGAPAGRDGDRRHPAARRGSWTGPRSCTRTAPPGTPARRARTTRTARVGIETPAGWLGVTGGELVSIRTEEGRTRSEFRLEQPGKFVTAIVGRLTDVGLRQEGVQAVRGFAGPRTRGETLDQMRVAQEVLAFYAERFGPPAFPSLGLVVAEGPTPGGHSPPGLLYLQVRPPVLRGRSLPDDPANFSDLPGFFLAHEAAHQWWGQATAPANYRERWLSEAWAQYAAALWVRERLGEGAFRGMMDRMARWALRYDSAGPIHLGQRLGHLRQDPRVFRAVVYDKGAWSLHMLRGLVGDPAFFSGRARLPGALSLREGRHRGPAPGAGRSERPRPAAVLRAVDLRHGPPWTITWSASTETAGPGFRTTIHARAQGLPGPLPLQVAVTTAGGREARTVTLEPAGGSWTIETLQEPRRVAINEDRGLLARTERVSRRGAGSAIAVAAALFLEGRDASLGLRQQDLVLFLEGHLRGTARVVDAAGDVVELGLQLVDHVLVDGRFLAGLLEALAPVRLGLRARLLFGLRAVGLGLRHGSRGALGGGA